MSDHKPECVLSDPCSADEPRHGFCGNSDLSWCIHCEQQCDCDRIKRAEDRVRSEHDEYGAMLGGIEFGAERSWDYALEAAREAVEATFTGWCKDYMNCTDYEHVCGKRREIIAAIDALREKPLASGGIYAGPPISLGDGCVIPKSDAIDALKEKS